MLLEAAVIINLLECQDLLEVEFKLLFKVNIKDSRTTFFFFVFKACNILNPIRGIGDRLQN
jgi:hypothetical protein